MSRLINAQNPLGLPVSLLALVAMSTTAWMASTVDLPFRKPNWFPERSFSPTIPGAVFDLNLPPALFSSSRVKSSSRRTTQELRFCLWNGSTCVNKLRTKYLTRSALSRPGVFLLITNLLVTILKARPLGSLSTSLIKSFQRWTRLFLMPCLSADFASIHASRSRGSPFERVNLRRAARHFRRRTDNWSFH